MKKISPVIEKKIEDLVGYVNFDAIHFIDEEQVKFLGKVQRGKNQDYYFKIFDSFGYMFYNVILTKENNNFSFLCDCRKYKKMHCCEHIAASFYYYAHLFFDRTEDDLLVLSKSILKKYEPKEKKTKNRQEIHAEIELEFYKGHYNVSLQMHIKIGLDRFYVVNETKFRKLLSLLKHPEGEIIFGKKFTFSFEQYYFKKEIEDFLYQMNDYFENSYYNHSLIFSEKEFPKIFKMLSSVPFSIKNYGIIYGIKKGNPFQSILNKTENHQYRLTIPKLKEFKFLTSDGTYGLLDHYLYQLDSNYLDFLLTMLEENIDSLVFEEEDLSLFSKGLFPLLNYQIEIDDSIKENLVFTKPKAKLYFDIEKELLTCHVNFDYQGKELPFYEEKCDILRNYDYENDVIADLEEKQFLKEKDKFYLKDLEKIGYFLEQDLSYFSEKYEAYTSVKLKETTIIQKAKVTSQFHIGEDNILSYQFTVDGMQEEEMKEFLTSLKQKKKYYRLKDGNLLNLENESFEEMQSLMQEMDLKQKGTLPKYQALYLDSLNQYSIIETDHQFQNFIDNFKKYKEVDLVFTEKENNLLRDYQKVGVKWLYQIYKCDFGGILADEMGLGKSLQILSLLSILHKEKPESKFLIVVPTALIYNWQNEFEKFSIPLSYHLVVGNKKTRRQLLKEEKDLYLTSYGLLREDIDLYQDRKFEVCVIDEAQNIKNPNALLTRAVKKVNASVKFALTGTPIENSLLELWSIFDFLMPGLLGSQMKFMTKYKNMEDEENLKKLKNQISPFLLRRKKKEVVKDLPDKIENNIYIDFHEKEKTLYASLVKDTREKIDEMIRKEGFLKSRFLILQLLTKLRQLCIDPSLLYVNYKEESSKMETLKNILIEAVRNEHKILIFSSFKGALSKIEEMLSTEKMTYYRMDGSTPSKKRMEYVENFNQDQTNVFLIMLKSGGTGLNLTAADMVIHLDLWWNPQAENQATDRAHRIGQKKVVEVIKLITKGTIEEKILDLQKKKQKLSDLLIEGESENVFSALTEEDVRNLLAYEQE